MAGNFDNVAKEGKMILDSDNTAFPTLEDAME